MMDALQIRKVFDAFVKAQVDFDRSVQEFKIKVDEAERAMLGKNETGKRMLGHLAEVERLAAVLDDLGARGPDIIENADMAKALRKGRELGEIHAHLEAHAPQKNATI